MRHVKLGKGNTVVSAKEKRVNITRRILLGFIILLAFLMQTTPGLFPVIKGVHANLLIPVVVCIGMFERDMIAAYFGLAAGVAWDTVANQLPGYHAIILMLVGCFCGLLITHLMRINLFAALFLSGLAILIHDFFYWVFFIFFPMQEGSMTALLQNTFPAMVYTFLLTPFIFFIVRAVAKKFCVGAEPV